MKEFLTKRRLIKICITKYFCRLGLPTDSAFRVAVMLSESLNSSGTNLVLSENDPFLGTQTKPVNYSLNCDNFNLIRVRIRPPTEDIV